MIFLFNLENRFTLQACEYNLNVMRQPACLVLTQLLLIAMLPSLIARRWVGRQTL